MNQQKLLIIISLLVTISQNVFTQSISKNVSPNQIEVSLYNGVVSNQANSISGIYKLNTAYSLNHNLMFRYNRLLSEQLSLSAAWGFGFQGFNYSLDANENFEGTKAYSYLLTVDYNLFHKLELKANYNLQLNRNDRLRFGIGGGVTQFLNLGLGVSASDDANGQEFRIDIEYPNQITPLAVASLDYVKTLKGKNEIAFGLAYNHSFKNVYDGDYSLYNNTSTGEVFCSGSNVGINVSYIFTGNKNKQKLNAKINAGEDSKLAIKELRKERRFLPDNSSFVNVFGGSGLGINKVDDPNNYVGNARSAGKFAGVEYEHGIKNNFFVSGGYHFIEYFSMTRIINTSWSSGSNAFWGHEFSVGGGYRWITPANLKILNFYAGLTAGFSSDEKGQKSSSVMNISGYYDNYLGGGLSILSNDEIVSDFICAAYIGVSKDFRLTDFFWLSLNYRYQHGFNPVLQSDFVFFEDCFELSKHATKIIDGTAHMISFGMKFRFK